MAGATAKTDTPEIVNPIPQDQLPQDPAAQPSAPPAKAPVASPKKIDVVLLQAVYIDGVEHPKGTKLSLDPKFVVRCLLAAGGSIANDLCEPLAAHEARQEAAKLIAEANEKASKVIADAMAQLKARA